MRSRAATLILLHILLGVYSLTDVLSKGASYFDFLSWQFVALYGGMLALLFIYAICWQQIIKRMPLSTAFANRAITIVWGIFWGVLLFGESITVGKVIGALLIIIGIVIFSREDASLEEDANIIADTEAAAIANQQGNSSRPGDGHE